MNKLSGLSSALYRLLLANLAALSFHASNALSGNKKLRKVGLWLKDAAQGQRRLF